MKPLTQAETDQLLILLRKLWKPHEKSNLDRLNQELPDAYMASIAKSLFSLITKKIYETK